nr:VWA domain-containing protein [Acidobacteriota bacterium]
MREVGTLQRWLGWVGGCLVAVTALSAQEASQQPTFRGGARFVRVDVYPTDGEGRPIAGLTAGDFEVLEDGKPQTIDTFEFVRVEPEPDVARVDPDSQTEGEALAKDPRARVFAIVLDTRHVDIGAGRGLQRPLTDMLDRIIGPRDMFGVITPQLPPRSFTLGRRSLTVADMLARYWHFGSSDRITPQDEAEELFGDCFGAITGRDALGNSADITRELVARHRERETLDFLDGLVDKLADVREERKSVVVVTQGWRMFGPDAGLAERAANRFAGGGVPFTGPERGELHIGRPATPTRARGSSDCIAQTHGLAMMDSESRYRTLMTKAQRANVAFYPVDPRGLAPFDNPISHGQLLSPSEEGARVKARLEALRELAVNTDGIAFVQSNDLGAQFKGLADSLNAYYLLGYYSTNTKFDGGYRKLTVRVKTPGVRLTARRGYIAPTEAEIAAIAEGRAAADRPPTADAAALSGALERLQDLRHDRDLFVQTARAGDDVVVNVELGVNARTSPAWAEGGAIRVSLPGEGAGGAAEGVIAPMRSGVSLRVPGTLTGEMRLDVRARAK